MSLKTNRKILFGTLDRYLEKKEFLGSDNNKYIIALSLYTEALEFAYKQYNKGDISYREKIEKLQEKISILKYECSEVCSVKDRIVITRTNNPPVVKDKRIRIKIVEEYTDFNYPEFIGNILDYDGDEIVKTWLESYSENLDLKINNTTPSIRQQVRNYDTYSVRLNGIENFRYLVYNSIEEPCVPSLLRIAKTAYEDLIEDGFVFAEKKESTLVFQKVTNFIHKIEIPYEDMGDSVKTEVRFKTQENSPEDLKNLISAVGTTTFEFYKPCEEETSCEGFVYSREIEPTEDTTFSTEDLRITSEIGAIKITEIITGKNDHFKFKNHILTNEILPLTISTTGFTELEYVSDKNNNDVTGASLSFVTAKKGSLNYCLEENTIQVFKGEHRQPDVTLNGLKSCYTNHREPEPKLEIIGETNCCNHYGPSVRLYQIGN